MTLSTALSVFLNSCSCIPVIFRQCLLEYYYLSFSLFLRSWISLSIWVGFDWKHSSQYALIDLLSNIMSTAFFICSMFPDLSMVFNMELKLVSDKSLSLELESGQWRFAPLLSVTDSIFPFPHSLFLLLFLWLLLLWPFFSISIKCKEFQGQV